MIKLYYSRNIEESDSFMKKALRKAGYTDIEIKRTENGKPYADENVFFSLSHTEDLIVCAVSDCEIGIDAEKIRNINNLQKIARKILKTEEITNDAEFLKLWTKHESRVKFFGETLFTSPEKLGDVDTNTFRLGDYIISVSAEKVDNIETEMI